jgi:hypothetical protein
MHRDARVVRGERPFILTNCFTGQGIGAILHHIGPVIHRFSRRTAAA